MFRDVIRDQWYRAELIRVLVSGPGAVSLYFALLNALLSAGLSLAFMRVMLTAATTISLATILLSLGFVIYDLWSFVRKDSFRLISRAAQRCENRLRQLKVTSDAISRFLAELSAGIGPFAVPGSKALALNMVKALDRLSETAARYGSCGKYVFEKNLEPLMAVDVFLQLNVEDFGSAELRCKIKEWLQELPYYDPEGWWLSSNESSWLDPDSLDLPLRTGRTRRGVPKPSPKREPNTFLCQIIRKVTRLNLLRFGGHGSSK